MTTQTATDVLNKYFLDSRSRLLDLAAALDRMDRAPEAASLHADPRWKKLHDALRIIGDAAPDRAERVQMLFSLPFDPQWRNT